MDKNVIHRRFEDERISGITSKEHNIMTKKLFCLAALLAIAFFTSTSCSKDPVDENPSETGVTGGEDEEWNYPESSSYEIVFYSVEDDLTPKYKPLTSSVEFNGDDYFITVLDKKTGTFISGDESYRMEVKILNGDDIFNLKVQKLTAKEYHECTLTPKALGSCTIGVKVSNPSDERAVYVQKADISVVRQNNYYLCLENSSSLPAAKMGFYGNTLEYKFCWKVNDGGSLSVLNVTDESSFKYSSNASTLTISEALSEDGTHIVYTVRRPSTSSSFLNEWVFFIYNTESASYVRVITFTTYSFSTY